MATNDAEPVIQAVGKSWYVAFLLLSRHAPVNDEQMIRSCVAILQASGPDRAYGRSIHIGRQLEAQDDFLGWEFQGIQDLLLRHEAPADGTEILWEETEITAEEVARLVKSKSDLEAMRRKPALRGSGWYGAAMVLEEVHDSGSHGQGSLVWVNTYLLQADSPEAAYQRSLEMGRVESSAGSHRCNGDTVHWDFRGLNELYAARSGPVDGAVLWYDEAKNKTAKLPTLITKKEELSAFQRS